MKIEQFYWTQAQDWQPYAPHQSDLNPQWVLIFGDVEVFRATPPIEEVQKAYPHAILLGCSTAGEIHGTQVTYASLVVTAIQFAHTQVQGSCIQLDPGEGSFEAGHRLAQSLDPEGLTHVFVLSDGIHVNGSQLVQGMTAHLPPGTSLTGGLAGDGDRFQETFVVWNDRIRPDLVAAVGLYGDRLKVDCGSLGGWLPFGPKRTVTKAKSNVLYELDGQSALELYKTYLGQYVSQLPAAALLFPLCLTSEATEKTVVRTILSIDEAEQTMTFAGDIPEGATVQLMRGNNKRLIDGAIAAAHTSVEKMPDTAPELAILISCVGRKLVLKQLVEEEIEGVREVLGAATVLTGFYSYGEIAPADKKRHSELHNQTMTITTLAEC